MGWITGHLIGTVSNIGSKISELPISEAVIFDLAIILLISVIFAFIAKSLKQPLIPAYVLAGLAIGPLFLGYVKNSEIISAFSEIGIAFLLFTAGLEFSFRKIKEANLKKIVFIGIFQVVAIFLIVYLLKGFLGLTNLQVAYFGVILAFSSTMVDIKLLSDRGELLTLHGRLILGILLLQDLIAIAVIVIFSTGGFVLEPILIAFAKLLAIIIFAIILQKLVLNKLFRFAAKSGELLFLLSLAVLFLFLVLSHLSGLSIVIGAFIAGVSLANSPFKIELESRVVPVRDFFAILFFVALGTQIVFSKIESNIFLLVFTLIVAILLKPFLTLIFLRIAGYQPKTSFFTAISIGQISEFSLHIGLMGLFFGVFDISLFSLIILSMIISMSLTPYFINYKDSIHKFFRYPLGIFKFLPVSENLEYNLKKGEKETLLVGAHRVGTILLKSLMDRKDKLLVIDYNPEIINALIKKKISCVYGDITSPDLLRVLDIKKLKLVISTVPGFEENKHLLKFIKGHNPKIEVVVTGSRISESLKLYEEGADYVITPKILAGEELTRRLRSNNFDLKKAKAAHLKRLIEFHKILY